MHANTLPTDVCPHWVHRTWLWLFPGEALVKSYHCITSATPYSSLRSQTDGLAADGSSSMAAPYLTRRNQRMISLMINLDFQRLHLYCCSWRRSPSFSSANCPTFNSLLLFSVFNPTIFKWASRVSRRTSAMKRPSALVSSFTLNCLYQYLVALALACFCFDCPSAQVLSFELYFSLFYLCGVHLKAVLISVTGDSPNSKRRLSDTGNT